MGGTCAGTSGCATDEEAVTSSECSPDACCLPAVGDCTAVGGACWDACLDEEIPVVGTEFCASACAAPRVARGGGSTECGVLRCCVDAGDCVRKGGTCRAVCEPLETFVPSTQCASRACCLSLADDCGLSGGRCADPGCGRDDPPEPSRSCPSRICCWW